MGVKLGDTTCEAASREPLHLYTHSLSKFASEGYGKLVGANHKFSFQLILQFGYIIIQALGSNQIKGNF